MTLPADLLRNRMTSLEQTVARLERQLAGFPRRPARLVYPREVRLCKTTSSGVTYPTSGEAVPIVFLDGDWTAQTGTPSLTENPRSANYQVWAWSLQGLVPEGYRGLAYYCPGRSGSGRWFYDCLEALEYRGLLNGEMLEGDSTGDVDNLTQIDGYKAETSLTAQNVFSWGAADNAVVKVHWVAGANRWEFYQVAC